MITESRYVIDTNAFINYYNDFFNEKNELSKHVRLILDKCLNKTDETIKLVIPSIVLIEIFRKFLISEEMSKKFYYEIFVHIKSNNKIEIKPIEKEVLDEFIKLNDLKLENHDRLIFASAIQIESPLISNDPVIRKYNKMRNSIPDIIF